MPINSKYFFAIPYLKYISVSWKYFSYDLAGLQRNIIEM